MSRIGGADLRGVKSGAPHTESFVFDPLPSLPLKGVAESECRVLQNSRSARVLFHPELLDLIDDVRLELDGKSDVGAAIGGLAFAALYHATADEG